MYMREPFLGDMLTERTSARDFMKFNGEQVKVKDQDMEVSVTEHE